MKKFISILATISSAFLLSACSDSLPKCGDSEVQEVLSKVFNDALKKESLKFIHAKNSEEIGFNKEKEIRVCVADVMVSNGEEEEVTYNISWANKKNQTFWVEIVN